MAAETYTLPAELKERAAAPGRLYAQDPGGRPRAQGADAARADHDRRVMAMRTHFSDAARGDGAERSA